MTCIVCGKPRRNTAPATLTKQGRADLLAMLAADRYCSTVCCKRDHGVQVDQPPPPPRAPHIQPHGTQQSYKNGCREDCCRIPESERRRLRRKTETAEQRAIQNERRRERRVRELQRKSVAV